MGRDVTGGFIGPSPPFESYGQSNTGCVNARCGPLLQEARTRLVDRDRDRVNGTDAMGQIPLHRPIGNRRLQQKRLEASGESTVCRCLSASEVISPAGILSSSSSAAAAVVTHMLASHVRDAKGIGKVRYNLNFFSFFFEFSPGRRGFPPEYIEKKGQTPKLLQQRDRVTEGGQDQRWRR
jgi:hypothetical protein